MNFCFIQVPLFAELADEEFWQSFFEVTHLQCKRARFAILTNSGVDIVFHFILVIFTRNERSLFSSLINRVKSYQGEKPMYEGKPEFYLKSIQSQL